MSLRIGLCCLVMVSTLGGCAAIGPPRVERDRIEYNTSITESWKRQILLNIIKIRYVEPLFFMDVGEVVSSYSMETGGSFGASRTAYDFSGTSDSSLFELGGAAKYTDRPTVTYRPLTGTAFFRGIMSPVPLQNVLASIEAGASAQFVMNLGLRSINGFRNETLTASGFRPADPEFKIAVDLLTKLQRENALHIVRESTPPDLPPRLYLNLTGRKNNGKTAVLRKKLQDVLGLDTEKDAHLICFGSTLADDDTIMLQTYSLAQMLASVSGRMDMPIEDVKSSKALPGIDPLSQEGLFGRVMVHSSQNKPQDAFTATKYRGNWFWVDDHDLVTKRVFSFIMLAFTLMDKGEQDTQLQLTVPTQ